MGIFPNFRGENKKIFETTTYKLISCFIQFFPAPSPVNPKMVANVEATKHAGVMFI